MRPFLRKLGLAVLLAAAACAEEPRSDAAPLDRFVFPSSLAVHDGKLLVVSSNFDLTFDEDEGGSLLQVDPGQVPAAFESGVRIPSFGGEVAIADAAECGLAESQALVPSRTARALFRIDLGAGGLSCGAGCRVGLDDVGPSDPYGVAVTCPPVGQARAWVGHLGGIDATTRISVVNLGGEQDGAHQTFTVPVGVGRAYAFAHDRARDRLFFTGSASGLTAPLRWIELGGGCQIGAPENAGGCPVRIADLWTFVRGAELRGIALSNDAPGLRRRAYVAARLYDPEVAASIGGRPSYDVGGVLLVLELEEGPTGELRVHLVREPINVGRGVSEVKVLPPRPGGARDLVVVTAADEGLAVLYDDEVGQIVRVFGRDDVTGAPVVGRTPFGLAVSPLPADPSRAYVYVSSFLDAFVSRIEVPLATPSAAFLELGPGGGPRRIGQESP